MLFFYKRSKANYAISGKIPRAHKGKMYEKYKNNLKMYFTQIDMYTNMMYNTVCDTFSDAISLSTVYLVKKF